MTIACSTPSTPKASIFWSKVCKSGGADSGCSTARGCGSKVMTVGTALTARALDVVGDVREVRAARSQLRDVFERAFEPEVRGVRAYAQAVEHERVQAA